MRRRISAASSITESELLTDRDFTRILLDVSGQWSVGHMPCQVQQAFCAT